MPPEIHTSQAPTPSAMAALPMHWNVDLFPTGDRPVPNPPEIVNILPGDTLVFTGSSATVTFPAGLTVPASGPVPGTFRIAEAAEDGCYAYCIDRASKNPAEATRPTVSIGLVF